jgi:hypothetical protein
MQSEFEEPIRLDIGRPERHPALTGAISLLRAAELLGVDVESVMRLVNEAKLRLYPREELPSAPLTMTGYVHGEDVIRILKERQRG